MRKIDFGSFTTLGDKKSQNYPSQKGNKSSDLDIYPWKMGLRTTLPFVTAYLEIFHCTHDPVIPESDLYFTFCSTLSALSKRTSK